MSALINELARRISARVISNMGNISLGEGAAKHFPGRDQTVLDV